MTINRQTLRWRSVWAALTLLGASAVLAQTCNPNTQSSFSSWFGSGDTVTDTSTGLVWQRCAYGQVWNGSTCSGTALTATWAGAVSGAPSGWRLPNVKELESIVERQCATPAINTAAFPATPTVDFWSSTPGWAVSFNDGSVLSRQAFSATNATRLVKDGVVPSAFTTGAGGAGLCTTQAPSDFNLKAWVENADSTLYDSGTGMTWDRCVLGQTWSAAVGACTGTPQALTWSTALQRANLAYFGGRNGWRVPNVKELESIIDRRCASPALNPDFFRGNQETLTWSSTPGWAVNMGDGSVLSGQATSTEMAVRLVRGGLQATAYDARIGGVPGAVVAGQNAVKVDFVSPNLLLPTAPNQKLIFLTHGWNSNSVESGTWPLVMLQALCARMNAPMSTAGAAAVNQVGVSGFCETTVWRVVAFNWGPLALDRPLGYLLSGLPDGLPWSALAQARNVGEQVGQTLINGVAKYDFVHMVGHSAGSNLLHEFGRQLKLANAATPRIHATFLDAFCGYSDRCDYGYWSDWADSYIDTHSVFALEGRQTRMTLCNAANFDVSATYADPTYWWSVLGPLGDFASDTAKGAARHAWPYLCYVNSAATSALADSSYNVSCMGNSTNAVGFGLSYLGAGSANVTSFVNSRTLSYPKGRMQRQTAVNAFSLEAGAACGVSALQAVANAVTSTVGGVTSTLGNVIGSGVAALTATCSNPTFTQPTGPATTAQLATCTTTTVKGGPNATAAGENVTAWSSFALDVGRRANQLRFTLQYTAPADGLLTVYVDDQPVYSTTRAVRGGNVYDTDFFDVAAMERGTHAVSFRLDALESAQAAVSISAIQVGAAALCDLDVDGDGAVTVARDGTLLLRYLMGFRGEALTDGLSISDANAAQAIADYVGSAVQFDVFGRPGGMPLATADGLALLRLMLGMSDDALLSGVTVPPGALFATGNAVRTNVNGKCGTRF